MATGHLKKLGARRPDAATPFVKIRGDSWLKHFHPLLLNNKRNQ